MEPTGVSIGKESWALLREEPLYSARFIDREGADELALVVRVKALDWFFDAQPPLLLDLASWRSPRGAWVVILSYQLRPSFGGTKGGAFYLNPRQAVEAEILRKLVLRESLPILFLSEDCTLHYTFPMTFDPRALATWRRQVEEIKRELRGRLVVGDVDPEFEAAVRELHLQNEG